MPDRPCSRPMATETVHVAITVEIAYDRPAAREDAIRCALNLAASAPEIGGGGINGCYNARRIGSADLITLAPNPNVKPKKKTK